MKLNLQDVTLCVADCVTPKLAARAIRLSLGHCDFARAILFTDRTAGIIIPNCEIIQIESLSSIGEYSHFLLKTLAHFIHTDYALVAQWDGYVVDPKAWSSEFRNFDYIGAKWPWHRYGMTVGNGGFSLRSKNCWTQQPQTHFSTRKINLRMNRYVESIANSLSSLIQLNLPTKKPQTNSHTNPYRISPLLAFMGFSICGDIAQTKKYSTY